MGLSRREKHRRPINRQLSFEPLEDRRVLSANSPLAQLQGATLEDLGWEVSTLSSTTPEGQLEILQRELSRYAEQNNRALATVLAIPTDPLIGGQWHLINSGQQVGNPDFQDIFGTAGEDINVAPVWNQGITGAGVVVAVIDTGVQTDHPDLAANISSTLQLDAIDNDGDANPEIAPFDPDNPFLWNPTNAHGTAVAGLIGAVADNGIGGTGVAPGVQIVPIRLIDAGQTEQGFIDAFRFATNEIDITNNSWGPGGGRALGGPTPNELLALRDSIIGPNAGRDGLGVIHVFASGNDADGSDIASYNGWINSRYTIGVTGVDHDGFYNNIDGTVTGYPEIGASVLVAAPTGSVFKNIVDDTGIGSGLWTTDTTDNSGFNISPDPTTGQEFDRDFEDNEAYTTRFNGTSAAAPLVSGVVALMLEANPNLSWRDVQEILVRSARQNAEFGEPANGADKTYSQEFPNTWITNQIPIFHDPDPWDQMIDPALQTYRPTLDPNLTYAPSPSGGFAAPGLQNHYAPAPAVLTTGAGYTVSQGYGTNREWIGYAHGTVDAELAVQLAQQWTTKNQALPDELTFTTEINTWDNGFVPRAQNTGEDNGDFVVPGGLGGETGFIDYYAEYFDDAPFQPDEINDLTDNERTDGPIELTVPDDNTMTIETIEISLTIDNYPEAMDHLRVMLISPNGTQSELNYFTPAAEFADDFIQIGDIGNTPGKLSPVQLADSLGSVGFGPDAGEGPFTFTFSTNRSWGERSDNAIMFDPTTGEPVVDLLVGMDAVFNPGESPVRGDPLQQGWQLHFENWGDTDLNVNSIEVAWHGSPIGADTQRILGLVGVDDNQDDLFNFSRVQQQIRNVDADLGTFRLGEVVNIVDPGHESMGANVTVFAHRDVNGNGVLDATDTLIDQFVTGADGNYYFDLVPDDYIISIDDPLGRTAQDDSLTPGGFLKDYQSQWSITSDFFKVWDYDANLEVPVDGTGTPFAWLDGNGQEAEYGMKNINFLLDPGAAAPQQVDFSGIVYADTNGDGVFNSDDVAVPEISVYGDVNRNGQFDAGEVLVKTDAAGQYNLIVPNTIATVMNVGVIAPIDWTATNPSSGLENLFVQPGDTFTNVDFALQPPGISSGNGSSQPGIFLGVVFADENADGIRQSWETGVPNQRVYIDANNTGAFDAGDIETITNVYGAYAFAGVSAGIHKLRVDIASPLVQTLPVFNLPITVTLAGAGTISDLQFGVRDTAVLDYGDLPASYGVTTLAEDGARHPKGNFFLGTLIDGELNGQPSALANLDDMTGFPDEDGIVFDTIVAGTTTTGRLEATASRYGGYLQGWMDFNGDNDFDDVIDGVSERVVTDKLLTVGVNEVFFDVPTTIDAATIFSRFRYGEFGIDTLTGLAQIGEVEDYAIVPDVPAPLVIANGPDFDNDGDVDGSDFLSWQRGFGKSGNAAPTDGDANGDRNVDGNDLAEWQTDFDAGSQQAALVVESGDFDADGDADGSDFLAWQRGSGITSGALLADGDANGNRAVDTTDLGIWQDAFGSSSSSSFAAASSSATYSPVIVSATASSGTASTNYVATSFTRATVASATPSNVVVPRAMATEGDSVIREAAQRVLQLRELAGSWDLRVATLRQVARAHMPSRSIDTRIDRSVDIGSNHLGMALRDRALFDLFADRREDTPQFHLGSRLREIAEGEDQHVALSAALGEEIDWRF